MNTFSVPVRRFATAAGILAAVQMAAFTFASPARAGERCTAIENYCYQATCSGGCTTKDCNGQGNCEGNASYKCYDCVRVE